MAQGQALFEEGIFEKGQSLNASFLDYRLPTATDVPNHNNMKSILVETVDPAGPFGAKEAGEGLTNPTAGALGNAVFQATGVSIKELPITPEKVLNALREKDKKEK